MIFIWLFLPATLVLYRILSLTGKQELKNFLLLFVSLLFYGFGEPKYLILLLVCAAVNYAAGLVIGGRKTGEDGAVRKAALASAVIVSLGLLGWFKYANFTANTVNRLAGRTVLSLPEIALPIGISFFTFQALSYTIDLYRGRCEVQKRFDRLLLYIAFFPQLIAGPIVRYRDVAAQITDRKESTEMFSSGVERFIEGLGKKVLLANTVASAADRVFSLAPSDRTALAAWFGLVLYSLQIYFDFSGYSDMAIGLGRMFGFSFLENFNLPFISASVSEFWRRWHISLSTWFQEYLYIPLGGNRKGFSRTLLNLGIVFLVTGLWHGAGWNYVLWGGFHGVFVILERIVSERGGRRRVSAGGNESSGSFIRAAGHIYCLMVVMISWVFFRCETPAESLLYAKSLLGLTQGSMPVYSLPELFGKRLLLFTAAGLFFSFGGGRFMERLLSSEKGRMLKPFLLTGLLWCCILLLAADSYNPFIYFRF